MEREMQEIKSQTKERKRERRKRKSTTRVWETKIILQGLANNCIFGFNQNLQASWKSNIFWEWKKIALKLHRVSRVHCEQLMGLQRKSNNDQNEMLQQQKIWFVDENSSKFSCIHVHFEEMFWKLLNEKLAEVWVMDRPTPDNEFEFKTRKKKT